MANRQRGEITACLDGRDWTLCLTLGALAGMEKHFCVNSLPGLAERLGSGNLSADDLIAIIHAGLIGGGHALTREEVGEMRSPDAAAGFARITAELLEATFADPETGSEISSDA